MIINNYYHYYYYFKLFVIFFICITIFLNYRSSHILANHDTQDKNIIFIKHDLTCKLYTSKKNKIITTKVNLPTIFTTLLLKYFNAYQGYAELTKSIFISGLSKKNYLLYVPKIGDAYKIYVNHHLIGQSGSFPPDSFSLWNKNNIYLINKNIIDFNSINKIKIIIYCAGYSRVLSNFYLKPIKNHYEFHLKKLINTITFVLPLFLNIFIGFIFITIFLILYFKDDYKKLYLTFILQLIPGIFVVLEPTMFFKLYPDFIFRIKIFGISWCLLVYFHLYFLHTLYNYKRQIIQLLLFIIIVIDIIAILYAKDVNSINITSLLVISTLTPLAIYNISLHIEQMLKNNDISKLFFPIGLTLAITAAHDGIFYLSVFDGKFYKLFNYSFDNPIFQYTSIIIFFGAGLIIVYQYISLTNKIKNMNIILEKKVNERTKQLKESLENLSKAIEFGFFVNTSRKILPLSKNLEEKLKQVIVYINNNYKESLSREGLASMVNLNHDYLSKAFKAYTGKKINQYINYLRVKEAIKLLSTTNKKIIDIALDVGFENLKTFNRAFKTYTGKTPSAYRKTYKNA